MESFESRLARAGKWAAIASRYCVMHALLLSLKPRYASLILDGRKRYELRRVLADVAPGTRVVLYASQPVCAIVGVCEARETLHMARTRLWGRVRHASGVSRAEFHAYFLGKDVAHALEVGAPTSLAEPIPLARLREHVARFQPPQSWRWLRGELASDAAVLRVIEQRLAGRVRARRRLVRAA